MLDLLIIIFIMTLVYMAVAQRIQTLIQIIALQGILLFGISFIHLRHMNVLNLIFILAETIIFKTLIVPYFLITIREKNKITKVTKSSVPAVYSLVFISTAVAMSFLLGHSLQRGPLQMKYFIVSLSALLSGIYFIIVHEKILTHVIGYLVLENGIFLLSIAIGQEMPLLINTAILLDIFVSVLILGMFINRIGNTFQSTSADHLTSLRD